MHILLISLHWTTDIWFQAIRYLKSDYLPTSAQSPNGITQLVKDISSYDLTKAEKLQIVNLAPITAVELYVVCHSFSPLSLISYYSPHQIVEELEDRLGDSLDSILSRVKSSLSMTISTQSTVNGMSRKDKEPLFLEDTTGGWDDIDADAIIDDLEFVDQGEGAGIEGDLDVEDEW